MLAGSLGTDVQVLAGVDHDKQQGWKPWSLLHSKEECFYMVAANSFQSLWEDVPLNCQQMQLQTGAKVPGGSLRSQASSTHLLPPECLFV